jgi:hypothetical protein
MTLAPLTHGRQISGPHLRSVTAIKALIGPGEGARSLGAAESRRVFVKCQTVQERLSFERKLFGRMQLSR